jgi:hypothetical protein
VPLCVALVLGGLGFLMAEHWYLQGRREDRSATLTEKARLDKVEVAREHMASGRWDEAVGMLEEVRADTEGGGQADALAGGLLLEARRGQAAALLAGARAAVAARQLTLARRLLGEYADHPQAADPEQGRVLRDELARAGSDEEAKRLLARLPEAQLERLAKTGALPDGLGGRDEDLRGLYKEALLRHLGAERRRRAAGAAALQARLRAAPEVRELTAFLAEVRRKAKQEEELAARQEKALRQVFAQLGVNGAAEQEAVRAGLGAGRGKAALRDEVARKRVGLKKAFRQPRDRDPAEADAFDRLVDRELDDLLKALGGR